MTTTLETLPFGRAINAGLRRAMERDPKVLLMGEDIAQLGGVFRITEGLLDTFGSDRVVDTPLAESGIIGTAIGMTYAGYRPVCEIQFDGFIFPAYDQITTQLAKLSYRTAGAHNAPVVIRVPYGGGIGAIEHHSESPEALFAHVPGLRVISPSNPADAYVMIQQAIASPDPVLYFEPKARYWDRGEVATGTSDADLGIENGVLSAQGNAQMQSAAVLREGTDVTVVAYGPTVRTAMMAGNVAGEEGLELEVIDLRSLSPIDFGVITSSVRKTGRLVVIHEAPSFLGIGAEIAARVTEECFYYLEAPVKRVGGFHTPYPVSKIEDDYLPNLDRLMFAIEESLAY